MKLRYNIAEKVASDDTLAVGSLSKSGLSAFQNEDLNCYGANLTTK